MLPPMRLRASFARSLPSLKTVEPERFILAAPSFFPPSLSTMYCSNPCAPPSQANHVRTEAREFLV